MSNKRKKARKRESVDSDESCSISEQPPNKRRRLNHNEDTDDNEDNKDKGNRVHPHYTKFAKMVAEMSPYNNSCNLHHDDNDDNDDDNVIMIGSNYNFNFNSNSSSNLGIVQQKNGEIRKLKRQITELNEKLRILRDIATGSFSPKYGIISIDKENGTIASKGIALLKKRIMNKFSAKATNVEITSDNHKIYKSAIMHFLKKNKNQFDHTKNAKNPFIAISIKHNNNNNNNNNKRKKNSFNWVHQRDLLSLKDWNKRNKNGELIINDKNEQKELMDKVQLITNESIMSKTVIGEYYGLQITIKELDDIYSDSTHLNLANLYAFEEAIDLEDIEDILNNDYDDSDHEISDNEQEIDELNKTIQEIKNEDNKFIIDAIGYQYLSKQDHLLMYAADCRQNASNTIEMNQNERNKQNVEYINATINGWPRIFVVSKRKIKSNEIICGYFGAEFTKAKYQTLKTMMAKSRMTCYIDDILNMKMFMHDYK